MSQIEIMTIRDAEDGSKQLTINTMEEISGSNKMNVDEEDDLFLSRIPLYTASKLDFSKIDTTMEKTPEDGIFRTHCALGYMHYRKMKELGLQLSKRQIKTLKRCKTCKAVKFTLKPRTQHKDGTSIDPFEHLHMDTAGPIQIIGKLWYVVVLIDDFSRYLKVFVVRMLELDPSV